METNSIKMRLFQQNKLWRDKAPEMLEATGSRVHTRSLTDAEYDEQLRDKLTEECAEVVAARDKNKLAEELADLFEVIDAFAVLHGLSQEEIRERQAKKRSEKGGFYERKFVTIAEHPEGSYGVTYCLADPGKYPEIL